MHGAEAASENAEKVEFFCNRPLVTLAEARHVVMLHEAVGSK